MTPTPSARRYRKRPVEVTAWRITAATQAAIAAAICSDGGNAWVDDRGRLCIETLEGIMHAQPGDYVVRGVEGEYYPCKASIFTATYEEVPD